MKNAFQVGVLDPLKADAALVIQDVVDWTPDTGGGIFGHNQDDNAMDYYEQARKTKGGLKSLTVIQRARLLTHVFDGATWDDEANAGMELLTTASDADARTIIKQLGWDRCRDELDIMPKFPFSRRYPRSEYR